MPKKSSGTKWTRIGEFKKTKRPDMLVGKIDFPDLNLNLRVIAFIKTNEQKKNAKDPDLVILLPTEDKEMEKPDISEELFN